MRIHRSGRSAPLPSSWERFSFGGESRGPRLTFQTTSNPQSQWTAILSGSASRWERSAELILEVWIKKWIYQPVWGDGRLVDGRLAGKSAWAARGKNREAEREPQSLVSKFRRRLNWLEQTSTIKPSAEPRLTPTPSPPPIPRGICEHYRLFLLSLRQSQDVWVLPHLHPQILQLFSAVQYWFYVPSHHALLHSFKALIHREKLVCL